MGVVVGQFSGGGGLGDVMGPGVAGNNDIAVFDGTTGKQIKDSGYTIASILPTIGNPIAGSTPWANLYIDGSGNLADGFAQADSSGQESINFSDRTFSYGGPIASWGGGTFILGIGSNNLELQFGTSSSQIIDNLGNYPSIDPNARNLVGSASFDSQLNWFNAGRVLVTTSADDGSTQLQVRGLQQLPVTSYVTVPDVTSFAVNETPGGQWNGQTIDYYIYAVNNSNPIPTTDVYSANYAHVNITYDNDQFYDGVLTWDDMSENFYVILYPVGGTQWNFNSTTGLTITDNGSPGSGWNLNIDTSSSDPLVSMQYIMTNYYGAATNLTSPQSYISGTTYGKIARFYNDSGATAYIDGGGSAHLYTSASGPSPRVYWGSDDSYLDCMWMGIGAGHSNEDGLVYARNNFFYLQWQEPGNPTNNINFLKYDYSVNRITVMSDLQFDTTFAISGILDNAGVPSVNPGNRLLLGADGTIAIDYSQYGRTLMKMSSASDDHSTTLQIEADSGNYIQKWYGGSSLVLGIDGSGRFVDGSNQLTIDPGARHLTDSGSSIMVDWSDGGYNSGATISFASGCPIINTIIFDNTITTSFSTNNRIAYDTTGANSVDWGLRCLYYTDGSTVSFNWASSEGFDTGGTGSFVWSNPAGVQFFAGIADWAGAIPTIDTNRRHLLDSSGNVVCDWEYSAVHGFMSPGIMFPQGISSIALGGITSVNTEQCRLAGSDNNTNLDFQTPHTVKVWHLAGLGTAPGIAAGTGAGTAPTISVAGHDAAGEISVTTGALPAGTNATVVTITFLLSYGTAPRVVLQPSNAITATLSGVTMVYVNSTTTTLVLKSGTTGLTAATAYKWMYHVIQ